MYKDLCARVFIGHYLSEQKVVKNINVPPYMCIIFIHFVFVCMYIYMYIYTQYTYILYIIYIYIYKIYIYIFHTLTQSERRYTEMLVTIWW